MIELDTDIKEKMGKLKAAMAEAAEGKAMKRELSAKLRNILRPLEQQMKHRVLGLPSKGHRGPSMRQAIAKQTKAATRWSGRDIGVNIIQRARSMPRNFQYAGRMFNREQGWHPKTLGGIVEHQQIRPTKWFDSQTVGVRPEAQRQIVEALDEAAATIAARAK